MNKIEKLLKELSAAKRAHRRTHDRRSQIESIENLIERERRRWPLYVNLNFLANAVNAQNHKWWHDAKGNPIQRNKAELICLMHSELSEAMEGERKDLMDDHLPDRKMVEVELADCVIRILDYCGAHNLDLHGALFEKLAYNQNRVDHSHKARGKKGGKKF